MKIRQRATSGFTIVEASVALAITVMLLMIVMTFWADNLVEYATSQKKANLLAEAHTALDTINDDIRLSATADQTNRWEDTHAPEAPDDPLSWESGEHTLVLASAVEDEEGSIVFADPAQYISQKNNIIYFVHNGTLYRRVLAAPIEGNSVRTTCPAGQTTPTCPGDRILAENVESFTVRYIDGENNQVPPSQARAVELDLKLATQTFNKDVTADYMARMVFRND